MVQRYPSPEVAIFDVEGTLINCVTVQLESWRRVLATAGHSVTHADLQPYSGMDGDWMLERLLPTVPKGARSELLEAQGKLYQREFLPHVRAFSAVRDLFDTLKMRGVKLGLATTCQKNELDTYDRLLHVLECTDAVACGDMVKHGKPDPALLTACLTQLGNPDPSRAVMIGDAPYDALAAKQLGMRAAGVLTGGFTPAALRDAGCDSIFSQVREVRSLWDESETAPILAASP